MKTFEVVYRFYGRLETIIIRASNQQNALSLWRIECPGADLVSIREV